VPSPLTEDMEAAQAAKKVLTAGRAGCDSRSCFAPAKIRGRAGLRRSGAWRAGVGEAGQLAHRLASQAAHKAKLKAKDAERKAGDRAEAEERRRATEAEAAAARKQAVEDEVAAAAAEAAAIAARWVGIGKARRVHRALWGG
jgi:hypothetical protein